MLTLILARGRNGAIGLGNGLPWHLPEDLAHFKRTTMGAPLLMGRKTWDSIGRPLPGRRMVVLSRQPLAPAPASDQVIHETDLDQAIARHGEGRELFVIGGADLYRQTLGRADRVILTEIDLAPEADTFFDVDFSAGWEAVSRQPGRSAEGLAFDWIDLRRRPAG